MNLCFFIGKITSDIKFKFIINSKQYMAISMFTLEVNKKCILKVKTYNELADKCYQRLVKSDIVGIQGFIDSNMVIIVKDIYYM